MMLSRSLQEHLDRFDRAAQDYAFRGAYSGSRCAEVVNEYRQSKAALSAAIGRALKKTYNHGFDHGYGRAQLRPSLNDMGG